MRVEGLVGTSRLPFLLPALSRTHVTYFYGDVNHAVY